MEHKIKLKLNRNVIAVVIIAVFVLLAPVGPLTQLGKISNIAFPRIIFVSGLILLSYLIFFLFLLFSIFSNKYIKWSSFALVALSFMIMESYRLSIGSIMMFPDFLILFNEIGLIGDAFLEYFYTSLPALYWLSLLLFGYLLANKFKFKFYYSLASLLILLFMVTGVLYKTAGGGTQLFPSSIAMQSYMVGNLINNSYKKEYEYATDSNPINESDVINIVVIVDESVRQDFFKRVVLNEIPSNKWNFYDFGLALSGSNCSAGSNLMLRKGVEFGKVEEQVYENGLIWSYARNAGFTSYLLDAQRNGQGNNYLDDKEFSMIDYGDTTPFGNDVEIVNRLSYLSNKDKTFTYIVKKGAHFPYSKNYPSEYSFTGELTSSYINDKRQEYINALTFQTGGFFKKLIQLDIKPKTIIFYTSDHGQNIEDVEGKTHCNAANLPSDDEGIVPFVVITNYDDDFINDLLEVKFDKMSHFDLMPLVKTYMGYKLPESQQVNADSKSVNKFNYGNPFGYFGSKMGFKEVDRVKYRELEKERWED